MDADELISELRDVACGCDADGLDGSAAIVRDAADIIARQGQRVAELEAELQAAADVLQKALPIGQVKAIGLLEVAAGVRELAETLARITERARWCGAVDKGIGFNVTLWDLPNCDGRNGKTLIEAAALKGGDA